MRSPWKIPCATPASGAWSLWTMSHPSHMKQRFQSEKPDDRETRGSMTTQRCRTTQRITPWRRPHTGVGDPTAVAKYPTEQTEKQATISDMLLLSRVRGRDENSHLMRVGTVREPRDKHLSVRKRNQSSHTHTSDHVVVNYSDEEEPEHLPRNNDHEVAQAE